jgi:hypothetical protein
MAEEQKKEGMRAPMSKTCVCEGECGCGCGCSWPRGHRAFRIILALVLLAIAFWVGVKMGELRAYLGYEYANWGGYGMMGNGYGYGPMHYGSGGWSGNPYDGGYGYGTNAPSTQGGQAQNVTQNGGTSSAPMIPATGTTARP